MPIRFLLSFLVLLPLAVPARATSVTPPTFAELVGGADYVVRARVKSVSCDAVARPGKPPLIFTNITLEVVETIAGNPPADPVLRMLGGRVGDDEMRVEGVPQFSIGEEAVLFVAGNGRNFYPLFAAPHGKYLVEKDAGGREFITRSNGVAMQDVAEIATPLAEGPMAELQRRLRSTGTALTPRAFADLIKIQRSARTTNEK